MSSEQRMQSFLKNYEERIESQKAYVSRKRIMKLVDEHSFVEIDSQVQSRELNFGFTRPAVVGDGVVTGYGTIDGQTVYLAAQEPSVYAGSLGEMHAKKISKAVRAAVAAGVPFIGLYDCGGARIEEGVVSMSATAELLRELQLAQEFIPVLSLICGPCPGSLAMVTRWSDFTLMHEAAGGVFVNGPMVINASEGKAVDQLKLGGAQVMAANGTADLVAADEDEMFAQTKQVLAYLTDDFADSTDDPNRAESTLDDWAMSVDQQVNISALANLIFDQNSVLELQSACQPEMFTGLARLDGEVVAVLGNQAPILSAAMLDKAKRFVEFCSGLGCPLINFVQGEGLEVSSKAEQDGLARQAADLADAFFRLEAPLFDVVIGKVYGPVWQILASDSAYPAGVYAWPTAEIALLPADTAATILYSKEIGQAENPVAARQEFADKYADELASPEFAARLGYVDDIIVPRATRPRLISSLRNL